MWTIWRPENQFIRKELQSERHARRTQRTTVRTTHHLPGLKPQAPGNSALQWPQNVVRRAGFSPPSLSRYKAHSGQLCGRTGRSTSSVTPAMHRQTGGRSGPSRQIWPGPIACRAVDCTAASTAGLRSVQGAGMQGPTIGSKPPFAPPPLVTRIGVKPKAPINRQSAPRAGELAGLGETDQRRDILDP